MKKIAIIPNLGKENSLKEMQNIIKYLGKFSPLLFIDESYKGLFDDEPYVTFVSADALLKDCDALLVLGGDGTILSSAVLACEYDVPILGINTGHMGYLAELDTDEHEYLQCLFDGNYKIDERMMLDANVNGAKIDCLALNEVLLSKGPGVRAIKVCVYVDFLKINTYVCDGMIISTPTGSTAYSLSSGGPILDPKTHSIIITPICPHRISPRSIVVSADSVISLKILGNEDAFEGAYLANDGDKVSDLYIDDEVVIKKSQRTTRLIRLKDHSFYEILEQKFKDWS